MNRITVSTKRMLYIVIGVLFITIIISVIIAFKNNEAEQNEGVNYDNDGNLVEIPEWITVDLISINEYSRPGDRTEKINGIVVHYVGNPGTSAVANRNYFDGLADSSATYASSNFIIGLDGEIIEAVPLREVAYCSNNRNNDTISIECCHPDATGAFNEATYESLVRLCKWLMELYDLKPDAVIRHYDVTGKACPLYFVDNPAEWDAFIARIGQE